MEIYAEKLIMRDNVIQSAFIYAKNGVITQVMENNAGHNAAECSINPPKISQNDVYGDCLKAYYVAPGFIDPHIHGSCGFDIMDFDMPQLEAWLSHLLDIGVSAVLPSVYTAPISIMQNSLLLINKAMKAQKDGLLGGAAIMGIHLEGPFINAERLGGMDGNYILSPSVDNYLDIAKGFENSIKIVTLAPELHGAPELIKYLRNQGVRILAGHTDATYDEGVRAFEAGVSGICHFYNACRGIHHREPGILALALVKQDIQCELIGDGTHVHQGAMDLLFRLKDCLRLTLISDSVKTTGMPDGEYEENGQIVLVHKGESRLKGGALHGGSCMLPDIVKKLAANDGTDKADIVRMASYSAREYLGRISKIKKGEPVDLVGMDKNMNVLWTVLGNDARIKA